MIMKRIFNVEHEFDGLLELMDFLNKCKSSDNLVIFTAIDRPYMETPHQAKEFYNYIVGTDTWLHRADDEKLGEIREECNTLDIIANIVWRGAQYREVCIGYHGKRYGIKNDLKEVTRKLAREALFNIFEKKE
mgnify:FL=1